MLLEDADAQQLARRLPAAELSACPPRVQHSSRARVYNIVTLCPAAASDAAGISIFKNKEYFKNNILVLNQHDIFF